MTHQRPLSLLLLLLLSLTACGGREPTTVIIHQLGDEEKTCEEIAYELDNIDKKVGELLPKKDTIVRNVVSIGAAIYIHQAAIIFMDLSEAAQHEVNALYKRYAYLLAIAKKKDCLAEDYELPPLPQPAAKKR